MKFTLILGLLAATGAFAATQRLLSITNDIDRDCTSLLANLDSRFDIRNFELKPCDSNTKLSDQHRVVLPQEAERGAVVFRKKGHDIIRLTSKNLSLANGGDITLDYLYNGLTKSRGAARFNLERNGDVWGVTLNKKPIKNLKFFGRRWFGELVGIGGYRGF